MTIFSLAVWKIGSVVTGNSLRVLLSVRCEKVLLQEQQGMGDYIHLTSCNEKMSLIFSLFRERAFT